MFNIISSRQILFQDLEYHPRAMKDAFGEREELTHKVKNQILVVASARPQVVPDWVRDTPEFKVYSDDGTIVEVVSAQKRIQANNPVHALSNIPVEDKTPVAQFADAIDSQEERPQTGWGAEPKADGWGLQG